MKKSCVKRTVSLFFVIVMVILTPVGTLSAYADQDTEETPPASAFTPTLEVTADGHIDAERLTQWVDAYLKADGWDAPQCAMSIGLWYPGTDETWLYNPDEWMYGVNLSKLPISMVLAEKVANGELTDESVITGITLEYALQTVLENSSGPSFYEMLMYLGGNTVSNCAELVPQYAGLPDSYYTDAFYHDSYYTARIMLEVTKTLYLGGDERFPNVLEYMKKSQPWDMFNRDENIRCNLGASQTHAASWGDGAGDYIHCTGVIYTPTPVILTIMMKNISDLDILGGVAGHIANLATELDAWQQQSSSAAETAATASADAEDENSPESPSVPGSDPKTEISEASDGSAAARPADSPLSTEEKDAPSETESAGQVSVPEETASSSRRFWMLIVSALLLLSLIGIAVFLQIGKKSARPVSPHRKRER